MDYKNPNYHVIFTERVERLRKLRRDPGLLAALKVYYRENPIDFIADWGITMDPRNIERGLPAVIPLIPFGKQREWLEWMLKLWRGSQSGLTEKSRDMGCSVNAMALFSTLALFHESFTAGVGSRKEDLVDKVGDPNTLFYKARMFLEHVPAEFRGGWSATGPGCSAHMKLSIPGTGSTITGEAGNNIGRGGRASMYLVDESAFLSNPMAVEASLSQTTNCRIDLSSVNGMDNPFAQKRHGGKISVFTFHWRDDPRKSQEWYEKQVATLNPIIVAQEIDLDYSASKEGILIPSAWVQAALGAHEKLGILPSGIRKGALDVADEGLDLNAFATRYGFLLQSCEAWSGVGSDIFQTVEKACLICDERMLASFDYDADGLGAGVRGDLRIINSRPARAESQITGLEFQGSGAVVNPDAPAIKLPAGLTEQDKKKVRTNKDFFANRKAQGWWALRMRFQATYRAVVEGMEYDPDEIISIPLDLPERTKLQMELSQPTYSINTAGKIIVDKAPDGARSPNHADAVMICYAPIPVNKKTVGVIF